MLEEHCLPVPEAEKFTRLYDMLDYNDVPTFCGFPLQHSIDDAAKKVFSYLQRIELATNGNVVSIKC